jgi:hypothetical protein
MGRAIEHTEKAQLLSFQDWEGIVENGLAFMAAAQFDVEAICSSRRRRCARPRPAATPPPRSP